MGPADLHDEDPEVVAYITTWCSDCWRSRRVLQSEGIPCVEIDIDCVPGAEEEMRRLNGGSDKVPTIVINGRVLVEPTDQELRDALQDL